MVELVLLQMLNQHIRMQVHIFDDDQVGQRAEAIKHAAAIRQDQRFFVEASDRKIQSMLTLHLVVTADSMQASEVIAQRCLAKRDAAIDAGACVGCDERSAIGRWPCQAVSGMNHIWRWASTNGRQFRDKVGIDGRFDVDAAQVIQQSANQGDKGVYP